MELKPSILFIITPQPSVMVRPPWETVQLPKEISNALKLNVFLLRSDVMTLLVMITEFAC